MPTATVQAKAPNDAASRKSPFQAFFARFDRARRYRELEAEARARAEKYRAQHERILREIAVLKESRQIIVDALKQNGAEVEERRV